jgi:LysM repeat protein
VFGYASMNFYAEFLAAIDVYAHYQQYFGTLTFDRALGQSTAKPVVAAARTTRTATSQAPARVSRAKTTSYTVRRGDTLAQIARELRTSIRSLMAQNRLASPTIYAGQVLLVR